MALDLQRNWDVMMADNLEKVMKTSRISDDNDDDAEEKVDSRNATPTSSAQPPQQVVWKSAPVHLPDEIILGIVEVLASSAQPHRTLAACCRLSLQWYQAAVPFLYARPHLYGPNFDPFVRAICPSINLHVRHSPLAGLVKVLDMSKLVHQGSKSTTARLLGRVKKQLEGFVAPQASFNISCLPALAGCKQLQRLDLSLVSESPPLADLFRAIANLPHLTTFFLPRSSGFSQGLGGSGGTVDPKNPQRAIGLTWPPNLENLHLSGGIDAHFLHGRIRFPPSLRHLSIEHCPQAKGSAVVQLLRTAVRPLPRLRSLKLAYLPRLREDALVDVPAILPRLRRLSVSADYIGEEFFDFAASSARERMFPIISVADAPWEQQCSSPVDRHAALEEDLNHPPCSHLRVLELTNSGNPGAVAERISPIDVLMAIEDGYFPFLRQVLVSPTLRWEEGEASREVSSLTDAMKSAAALASASKDDHTGRGLDESDDLDEGQGEIGVYILES